MKVLHSIPYLIFSVLLLSGCGKAARAQVAKDQVSAEGNTLVETKTATISAAPAPHRPVEGDTVQTRLGQLDATCEGIEECSLRLNGQQILQLEWQTITLERYFQQPDRDIILFSSNGVGTAFAAVKDNLTFLVLSDKAEPKFISLDDFYAYPPDVEVMVSEADRIALDLGFDEGKHKFAELNGDDLKVRWETAPKEFLGEETCRMLYKDALGACLESREMDASCEYPQDHFPGYLRGIDQLDDPGFVSGAFTDHCISACRAGKATPYGTFAREVCSKGEGSGEAPSDRLKSLPK